MKLSLLVVAGPFTTALLRRPEQANRPVSVPLDVLAVHSARPVPR